MPAKKPVEKFRKDYTPPDYWIHEIQLVIKIHEESAQVVSPLSSVRISAAGERTEISALCSYGDKNY